MILIACSIAKELAFLTPQPNVEVLVTGVGPVEAAAQMSRALATGRYDLVINAGIAGALPGFARIGDGVVVAEEFLELDVENGERIALPDRATVHDRASSDLALTDRLVEAGFRALRGVTVSRVTATEATAARLAALGAEVESMEGFAVLRAAEIAAVTAIEVRGISNRVGERAQNSWDWAAGLVGLERVLNVLLSIATPPA